MNDKKVRTRNILILLLSVCIALGLGFFAGKNSLPVPSEENDELKNLQELNRSSIEHLPLEDGPIYVVGHRSPDADTVCSAIAYAGLLEKLGYDAQPVVADKADRETAYILKEIGVETPEELIDASGKNIFLVDHNEYAQAAEGMEDANIVGILDHHGVGSVTTGNVIVSEIKPIGATATIVWLDYLNYGIEIDQKTAHILLAAVLSDTYNLTTSLVIEADRAAVTALKEIAGVADTEGFYQKMHAEKLSYEGMTDGEILFSDYKEYEAGNVKFGIGLTSCIDEDAAKKIAGKLKNALPDGLKSKDISLLYGTVTIRENELKIDYIVPADEASRDILLAAFPDYDEFDGTSYIYRSGLGRKSKMVPGLTDYLSAYPHE